MAKQQPDQKAEERRRLKDLAFSNGLLSRVPSRQPPAAPLVPSKTVVKHQGRDIVKKGQRKNRFLFSFPGFLAPVSGGGKIGELSNLSTGNPILYLDFPQGRIKLFGTIVYPKNRYLTLQFGRKNVLCDDSFDSMVVFTDAWWIGRKEDNPEENQLKFPNELNEKKQADYDFKGGAGDIYVGSSASGKPPVKQTHLAVPDVSLTDDMSEDSDDATKDAMQLTPVRHSTRTAGKSLNYAEYSSEEVSLSGETNKLDAIDDHCATEAQSSNPYSEMPNTWSPDVTLGNIKNQETEVKKTSTSKSKGKSSSKRGPLVQATLSTLFEKSTSKI